MQTLDLTARGVAHVLRDRQLAVPPYQRPFAWTIDNVSDFWLDLQTALDRGDNVYFLGAIVLAGNLEDERRDLIIDGQQRLATTSVLIAAFRDSFLEMDDGPAAQILSNRYLQVADLLLGTEAPRLKLNSTDGAYYTERIISRRNIPAELPSHRRLDEAYQTLLNFVRADLPQETQTRRERISQWIDFLDESVQVITVDVANEADAFLIFETLNDRGAPLTIADLLKTYLLSRSENEFQQVEANWSQAISTLGDFDEVPEVVDFLRHYWSSLHGSTRERDLYRNIRDTLTSADAVSRFSSSLPAEAERYAAILDFQHSWWKQGSELSAECMRILNQLGLTQNRPLLLAILDSFQQDEKELLRSLRALVSWSVRGLIVGGIGGGRTERSFANAAVALREARITSALELFDNLRPIIASDDDFRRAFETASVPRRKIADYLLKALESYQTRAAPSPTVATQIDQGAWLHPVMPPYAAPDGWPGFAPDDISQWASKLGNYVLLDRTRRPRAPGWSEIRAVLETQAFEITRMVTRFDTWRPASIRARQTELAGLAVNLWPRRPPDLV